MSQRRRITVLIDNVRSVHNVGSMFRTADAFGVEKIYLVGLTPAPVDRFGRERSDFIKVSLGSERTVAWELSQEAFSLVEIYRKEGFLVVALEQGSGSVSLSATPKDRDVLLIVGSETDGVSHELLALTDTIAEIPMRGAKESLNVAVAFGIALSALVGI